MGEEWHFTYHDGYTEVTEVLGRTEQYHYDYNNELTKRVFADGSAVLMERDGLGRLLSHTDAMGRVTRYQYSNEGQVETIVHPRFLKKLASRFGGDLGFFLRTFAEKLIGANFAELEKFVMGVRRRAV